MAIGEFKKYNPKDLEHLHDIEIMILKDILKILNKNNIPFFICSAIALPSIILFIFSDLRFIFFLRSWRSSCAWLFCRRRSS